ncbi:MAG: autotransporter domain-containing protein [Reyranella sp.]|nr:autotransporter domain-containing protein [Reyranella sp.]
MPCLAAPIASGPAQAQFNLYPTGATSVFVPFVPTNNGNAMNYVAPDGTLANQPGQVWLSLNGGPTRLFTMDTGSTGIIAAANIFPTGSQQSLGSGSQYYSSSGVQLYGQYYAATVNIMSGSTPGPVLATASVVALQAQYQTCAFLGKGCTPGGPGSGSSNPLPAVAYMGVGFDRGDSAITPTYTGPGSTNVNPFINITQINVGGTATNTNSTNYSQGYVVTNTGVWLGLTNTNTANYAFVKLAPNPTAANQQAATWSQAPMTIAVGGATGSGLILPDSGIAYSFLTPPPGANIGTFTCNTVDSCANSGQLIQIYLPGQTTPQQLATYNFTTGSTTNPLTPAVVQVVPGSTVFINTGRQFYSAFNYFFDSVNGFVGYQWTGNPLAAGYGSVIPIVALQGNVTLPTLSSTIPTYLMANTTLSSPGTVVLGNSVSGPGALTIASGDFSLTGSNTYTGGTVVNGGSLSLGPGSTLPFAGALTVNGGAFNLNGNTQFLGSLNGSGGTINLGNGLLVLNTTQSSTLGSSLAGNGQFTVQGGGSLSLTGNNGGFSGNTVVSNASLNVGGSLGGNVFVLPGSMVSGNGSIANLFNSGVMAPGNSIGTMTVAGNFSQTASGTYATEVVGSGQSDRVNVGGTATLGGQVFVSALPGMAFAPSTTYTILNAAGGLSGTFASVNELYPFLQSSLSYDANNVYLNLTVGGFAAQALNNTQYAVGAVLDANAPTATGDFATVLGTLATATAAQGQAVMTAISGNNYAGFSTSMVQGMQLFMNNFANQTGGGGSPMSNRVALAEACDVACDTTSPPKWGAWGGALGGLGTVGAGQPVGTVTYNAGGFAAGLDRLVTDNFRMGVTAGYSTGTQWVGGFDGLGRSNTFQVGLYGGFAQDKVYADGLIGYAYTQNQMWRNIPIPGLQPRTAYGNTGANQWYGQLETGYRFDIGTNANAFVTPFARLQAYTANQNAFTETGAQSLNLSIAQQQTNSLRSVIGAQLGGSMDLGWREKLFAQLRLGWSHEYADVGRPVTATLAGAPAMPFTTWGVSPQRDGVVIGLGANTAIADATSVYLRYEGNISGQDSAHAITVGVRMTW